MKRLACPLGTIVRSRNDEGGDILIFSLRRGRKHNWFNLSGYDLAKNPKMKTDELYEELWKMAV